MDKLKIGTAKFQTLVAITEDEHCSGLMFRKWPPPIMCFPYKTAEVRKFWMKNTISPLDIIFCRAGKVIDIYHGEPMSEKHIGPDESSDLVVEMPLGFCDKFQISKGSDVKLLLSLKTIARKYEHALTKSF